MFQPNVAYITNIKIAQNILPILNAPPPQNRHFDQSSSFGMISESLLPEKTNFIPMPFL